MCRMCRGAALLLSTLFVNHVASLCLWALRLWNNARLPTARMYRWAGTGSNATGCLGVGDAIDRYTLEPIVVEDDSTATDEVKTVNEDLLPLVLLVCGGKHTLALDSLGSLHGCGSNEFGQLAAAETVLQHNCFASLHFPHMVQLVACGWEHSVLVTNDGKVFACGSNASSQLGCISYGGSSSSSGGDMKRACLRAWAEVESDPVSGWPCAPVVCVGAGHTSSFAACRDGSVFAWGSCRHGSLGLYSPHTHHSMVVCSPRPARVRLPEIPDMLEATAHAEPPASAVARVTCAPSLACGRNHTLVLLPSGLLVSWGSNKYGQCGQSMHKYQPTQATVPASASHVVRPWLVTLPLRPHSIVSVAAGWNHCAVVTEMAPCLATTAAAAASVSTSVLPLPGTASSSTPNSGAVLSALPQRQVWTWGRGHLGQLGRRTTPHPLATKDTDAVVHTQPRDMGCHTESSGTAIRAVGEASGSKHIMSATTPTGDSIGFVDLDNCSSIDGTPRSCDPPGRPAAVACGSEHTLLRFTCGCVGAWGWNEHGNLGVGDNVDRVMPMRVLHSKSATRGTPGGGGTAPHGDGRAFDVLPIAAGGAASFIACAVGASTRPC